jgi:hypothetical protein
MKRMKKAVVSQPKVKSASQPASQTDKCSNSSNL